MMDANEESEIFESLGRVTRTAAAGGMQTAETASRRAQISQSAKERETQDQQRHAETVQRLAERDHKQEASVASVMRNDSYQRHFWKHAGSEQIADYVAASAHLAPRHAEARSAYMHLSDVLRNDYGINIEQMNRDHPTSLMDRHHALRDALDDYFNHHRMDAEADQARGQQKSSTIDGETEQVFNSQNSSAEESQARAAAAQADSDKADSLGEAQRHQGEARKDAAHARAEEATGGRQPNPYSGASDTGLAVIGERNPQAAAVRERTRQNFPQSSTQRVFATQGPSARRAVAGRASPVRDLEVGR